MINNLIQIRKILEPNKLCRCTLIAQYRHTLGCGLLVLLMLFRLLCQFSKDSYYGRSCNVLLTMLDTMIYNLQMKRNIQEECYMNKLSNYRGSSLELALNKTLLLNNLSEWIILLIKSYHFNPQNHLIKMVIKLGLCDSQESSEISIPRSVIIFK